MQLQYDYAAHTRARLGAIKLLYEESFPYEERRSWAELVRFFKSNRAHLVSCGDQELLTFAVIYILPSALFIEYLCTVPEMRGQGVGTMVLEQLQRQYSGLPLLLECEPPSLSALAARRFDYYQRVGFRVVTREHSQPAYHADSSPVPLYLLAHSATPEAYPLLQSELKTLYCTLRS